MSEAIALLQKINQVEKVANMSKLGRFLHHPLKYFYAIAFRSIIYRTNKKEQVVNTSLFFNKTMNVALPSSTDIYLTGGKSHFSEIRLAKYLIRNLHREATFLDIGAHYGYFTLIAAHIIELENSIYSFEPSSKSFAILQSNTSSSSKIKIFNKAVADSNSTIDFYEFTNLYSEYNSIDISQFEGEPWFKENGPKKVTVETISIDTIHEQFHFIPSIIKIDVEGAELEVIKGATNLLQKYTPIIVIEYLEPKRKNEAHKKTQQFLSELGYLSYIIDKEGYLIREQNIDAYLEKHQLESDNIVFCYQS